MAEADIHAVLLLSVIPVGLALLAKYCLRPQSLTQWALALVLGLLGFVLVMVLVMIFAGVTLCGADPSLQWSLPAFFAAVSAGMGGTRRVRALLVISFCLIAVALSVHFRQLLRQTDRYVGLYMGEPVISCDKPVQVVPEWHSRLTGIYSLKPALPERQKR